MKYKPQILVGYAQGMIVRAVVTVIGWMVVALILAFAFQFVLASEHELIHLISLGRINFNPYAEQVKFNNRLNLFLAAGFLFGIFRTGRLRVEAQKIMCMVEQEKHLRRIALGWGGGNDDAQPGN